MKKLITFILLLGVSSFLSAQTQSQWISPTNSMKIVSSDGEESMLNFDPGFKYADFQSEGRSYHYFFNRDIQSIKNIRIVDTDSKLQIARGKGSWFWGNAKMVFVDGEIFKLKMDRNKNGYTVIGPYGPLFTVENQKITSTTTYNEKDLLTQVFFVFDRLRTTQKPPSDVIIIAGTGTY